MVTATHGDIAVSYIQWSRRNGVILHVHVEPGFRRRGIATALLRQAQVIAADKGIKPPRHNPYRTNNGEAWARSLGEPVPPRRIQ